MKDRHKDELVFSCSHVKIRKDEFLSDRQFCETTRLTKPRAAVSSTRTEITGAWDVYLRSKICCRVNTGSMQRWPAVFSNRQHSQVPDNRWRIIYVSSFRAFFFLPNFTHYHRLAVTGRLSPAGGDLSHQVTRCNRKNE